MVFWIPACTTPLVVNQHFTYILLGRQVVLPIDVDVDKPNAAQLLQGNCSTRISSPAGSSATEVQYRQGTNEAQGAVQQSQSNGPKEGLHTKQAERRKMDPQWLGPYMIAQELGKGFYKLESHDSPADIVAR